LVGSWR